MTGSSIHDCGPRQAPKAIPARINMQESALMSRLRQPLGSWRSGRRPVRASAPNRMRKSTRKSNQSIQVIVPHGTMSLLSGADRWVFRESPARSALAFTSLALHSNRCRTSQLGTRARGMRGTRRGYTRHRRSTSLPCRQKSRPKPQHVSNSKRSRLPQQHEQGIRGGEHVC